MLQPRQVAQATRNRPAVSKRGALTLRDALAQQCGGALVIALKSGDDADVAKCSGTGDRVTMVAAEDEALVQDAGGALNIADEPQIHPKLVQDIAKEQPVATGAQECDAGLEVHTCLSMLALKMRHGPDHPQRTRPQRCRHRLGQAVRFGQGEWREANEVQRRLQRVARLGIPAEPGPERAESDRQRQRLVSSLRVQPPLQRDP